MNKEQTTKKVKNEKVYDPRMIPRNFGEMVVKDYIQERLNDQLSFYDNKSKTMKSRYLNMRAITVTAVALVPVLVNLAFPYVNLVTTVLSITVVLLISLESVFHFREQWVNYRSTSEYLRKEYFLFSTKEGVYHQFDNDEQKAFRFFVEKIEAAIESENASTLQVMTTVAGSSKPTDSDQEVKMLKKLKKE